MFEDAMSQLLTGLVGIILSVVAVLALYVLAYLRKKLKMEDQQNLAKLAEEAAVKRLLFFHHDPERSDQELDEIVNRMRDEALARGCTVDMGAAAEGRDYTLEEN